MDRTGYRLPEKLILVQPAMLRVCYALILPGIFSVYLFGWRSLALIAISFICGIAAEAVFAFREGKSVTSAVFVTCMIFSLSLPPTLPLWMAAVGIVVGVGIGKMAFGGMGRNVFNPAMVGRCFIYITFPIEMTNTWVEPMWKKTAGFVHWSPPVDAITQATPLTDLKKGVTIPIENLLIGNTAGSLGETSVLLIVLGAGYIIYKKAAPWRLALSCLAGGVLTSFMLLAAGAETVIPPLQTILSGSFLFGTAFVVTEPITGAKTVTGQWIYGFAVGSLSVAFRTFSNFSEGIMFSILLMNAAVPILDRAVSRPRSARQAAA